MTLGPVESQGRLVPRYPCLPSSPVFTLSLGGGTSFPSAAPSALILGPYQPGPFLSHRTLPEASPPAGRPWPAWIQLPGTPRNTRKSWHGSRGPLRPARASLPGGEGKGVGGGHPQVQSPQESSRHRAAAWRHLQHCGFRQGVTPEAIRRGGGFQTSLGPQESQLLPQGHSVLSDRDLCLLPRERKASLVRAALRYVERPPAPTARMPVPSHRAACELPLRAGGRHALVSVRPETASPKMLCVVAE